MASLAYQAVVDHECGSVMEWKRENELIQKYSSDKSGRLKR